MAYTVADNELGFVDLYAVDSIGPGALKLGAVTTATYGRLEFPGLELRGVDQALGGGKFMFVQAAGTITAGGVCELTATSVNSGARIDVSAQPWAGAANSGKPLGVALAAMTAGQWGWIQTEGIAVTNTNGTVAAGDKQSWQASGVISSTVVASKGVLNALAASANGATYGSGSGAVTLSSSQSLILLNRPCAQGAIT
jgi:hypothetical protein